MKTASQLTKPPKREKPKPSRQGTGDEILGRKLRALRLKYNLTLRELEKESGHNNAYFSQVETGKITPGLKTMLWLARFYETTVEELAGHLLEVNG
jgi:putative transcriptional regulator